jgi:hypothetical protein
MNDRERARALSALLDAASREPDVALPEVDEELRALVDLGSALGDLRAEPDAAQRAALERMLQAHRADIARAVGRREATRREAPRPGASMGGALAGLRAWFSGWRLPAAVGVLVVMLIIAILALVGPPGRSGEERIARAPSPTAMPAAGATVTPGTVAGPTQEPTIEPSETPLTGAATQPTLSPTSTATPVAIPPSAVALHHVRGIVEIQGADGRWEPAGARPFVRAGEDVRTGALSGVEMAFDDGSVARVGADAQITVDRLQPTTTGARAIELTQWRGESEHTVARAEDNHGWYVVRTPSGTGTAVGTAFQVRVTPALASWFSIDEGMVRVSNLGSSVVATAGQAALSRVAEAPGQPVYRVRGEGEVTETGPVWRIAGQAFVVDEASTVVGDPQVGDWVSVEGHVDGPGTRYADRIVLLTRSAIAHVRLTGEVDAIDATAWTIAGQQVTITPETDIEEGLQVGDAVSVDGTIEAGGTLVAEHILYRGDPVLGEAFSYVGVVQSASKSAWMISDVQIAVNGETATDADLPAGSVVLVRGNVLEDGSWLARSIRRASSQQRTFEFVGEVEQVDPWTIAGIDLETDPYTVIDEGIGEDDRVRVQGLVLDDGTRVAEAIKWDDRDRLAFAFVGTVERMDPWQVSGIALAVDDDTEIDPGVDVDGLVRVTGHLAGTEWVAERIEPATEAGEGAGCIRQYSVVTKVDAGQVALLDGATLTRGGTMVEEGTLERGAVVEVTACTDGSGNTHVVGIAVLSHVDLLPLETPTVEVPTDTPSPVPPPSPVAAPSPTTGDEPAGKVTICHNGQTIEISWDAWPAHEAIGDTMGPCPEPDDRSANPPAKPTKEPKPTKPK